MWIVALVSCVIGIAFTWVVLKQYLERRRPYQLFWSIGLAMFALATFGEFIGNAFGWSVPIYKLYYFAGVALPGFFGVGTVYLMTREKPALGHVYAAATILVALLFLIRVAGAELNVPALEAAGFAPNHAEIMPASARRPYSVLLSAVGGVVLIAGALYSWLRHGLTYNRLIALGGFIFVIGGMFASRLEIPELMPFTNLLGIILIYLGVQQAARFRQAQAAAQAAQA